MTLTLREFFQVAGLGFLLALFTCLDPPISAWIGIDRFPFMLSAILAAVLVFLLVVFLSRESLWRERDRWAIFIAVGMAQFSGIALGKLDMLEVATVGLFGFWIIQTLAEGDRRLQISPVLFFVLGLYFLSILSMVNRPQVTSYIAFAEKFILFFLVVDFLRRRPLVKASGRFLIWAGAFSALAAIVQFVAFAFWGKILTLDAPDENPQSILKPTFLGMMVRVIAFFPNPAGLNDYLLFVLPLALFAMTVTRKGRHKVLYGAVALMMAAAVLLTWSAAALIGVALIAFLFFYIHRPSLSIQYSGLVVLGTIGLYELGFLKVAKRLFEGFGGASSGSVRMDLLQLGFESLRRSPFIGLGIQNFGSFSKNYFPTGPYIFKYPVHNAFVQMAAELGIFGGLLFVGVVAFISLRLLWALSGDLGEEQWIFKGFLLGWIAIVFHMMTEPMAYEGTLWLILGLIEGCAITMARKRPIDAGP